MRQVFLLVVLATLLAVVLAAPIRKTVQRTSSVQHCVANRPHVISYNVASLDDDSIILLDNIQGVKEIECDIDSTRLLVSFSSSSDIQPLVNKLHMGESFVTASDKWNCVKANNLTSVIMRRVMGINPIDTLSIELETTPARYDELIQDGTIEIGPDSAENNACTSPSRQLLAEVDKQVCLGVNSDSSCTHAAKSLPVYSNQYMSVDCANCFLGVEATVFASLSIHLFKLQQLSGGLKNIAVNGAFELDMNAHAAWSTGVDKTLPVVKSATIINFWVGPIPVRVWFEIPVEMKADLSFTSSASATVGATANWNIGDAYVEWDSKNHWQVVKPSPKFSWAPVINGQAQFNAEGSFSLKPTVTVHLDNLFQSSLVIDPVLSMQAQGSTADKQLCASLGYDIDITVAAELDINISWLNIHDDRTFGPKSLYASGNQSIGHWCVAGK